MADKSKAEDAEVTEDESTDTGEPTEEPDYKAEADKWKAMSRKHEAAAKANAEAAKKLKEFEDKDKSEAERVTERLTAAETRAAEAEAKATRYEVAGELGIKPKHLKYLSGSTREEIEEAAGAILEDFPETYATDTEGEGPTRPKERLRPGAKPDSEPEETDPEKLAALVPRR